MKHISQMTRQIQARTSVANHIVFAIKHLQADYFKCFNDMHIYLSVNLCELMILTFSRHTSISYFTKHLWQVCCNQSKHPEIMEWIWHLDTDTKIRLILLDIWPSYLNVVHDTLVQTYMCSKLDKNPFKNVENMKRSRNVDTKTKIWLCDHDLRLKPLNVVCDTPSRSSSKCLGTLRKFSVEHQLSSTWTCIKPF